MTRTAFDLFHPIVAFFYFASLLIVSMVAMQPVYLVISFCAALAYSILVRGFRVTVRALAWQLPLVAVLALANFVLSPSGSTELFRIGVRAFYLESLVFGACMGLMLACVLLIFSNAARVLTSDKVMALFGSRAPTVALMLSMIARLVPQFVRRGQDIAGVQRACTAARCDPAAKSSVVAARRNEMRSNLRLTSVLMGWSMEDSLETADAMKARGWGVGTHRTTYARYHFRRLDACVLISVAVLAVASAATAGVACAAFRFYPTIAGIAPWWNYVPFVLYVAVPLVVEVRERVLWRS